MFTQGCGRFVGAGKGEESQGSGRRECWSLLCADGAPNPRLLEDERGNNGCQFSGVCLSVRLSGLHLA